MKTARFLTLGT